MRGDLQPTSGAPSVFDAAEDEVWLDAAALRARVAPQFRSAICGPVSGGQSVDARTATMDAQLDELAEGVRSECARREDIVAIGYQRCEEGFCFDLERHPGRAAPGR